MVSIVTERGGGRVARGFPSPAFRGRGGAQAKLRARRLGWKFRSQHSIGPFVADFVCLKRKLIIEADGGQHNAAADRPRTAYLRKRGFRVLRFWNNDILQNIEGVLAAILLILDGKEDPRG
ncbi:MAG: endonuclease domain-containing protein [Allosphingosinicella sp.]